MSTASPDPLLKDAVTAIETECAARGVALNFMSAGIQSTFEAPFSVTLHLHRPVVMAGFATIVPSIRGTSFAEAVQGMLDFVRALRPVPTEVMLGDAA